MLLCPWNSPGKNTGEGCHFLLPVNLPNPPSLVSLALASRFFTTAPPGKPSQLRDPQILISSCVSTSVCAQTHTHTHTHKIPFAQENSHSLSPPQHSPLTPTQPLKETGSGPQIYTTPETCPQSSCLRTSPSPPLLDLRATAILDHLLGVPPTH